MAIFSHPDFDNHEGIYMASDAESNLKAIIAVHSTHLGPAAGGTRFWTYADDMAALKDALRLSKAMSYKNAMAGIPHGGGKGVIIRPADDFDRVALFTAYGRAVNNLSGKYYAAEDVGVSPSDMEVMKYETNFVAGLNTGKNASGDPSPITADGVFRCLKVAAKEKFGTSSLKSLRVAVQGLGHVGYALCQHLSEAGAKLVVADINNEAVKRAEAELGASAHDPQTIHAVEVDIFAPCALGGIINSDSIGDIKASIIGGAANNQLACTEMGEALSQRDILYCPDYVVNAGGIINVAAELSGDFDPVWVDNKLEGITQTLKDILDTAKTEKLPTNLVADHMARSRLGRA